MSGKSAPLDSRGAYDVLWQQESNPKVSGGTNENIYVDNNNSSVAIGLAANGNFDVREQMVLQKEKELQERKLRLDKLEKEVNTNDVRNDNWPCPMYPFTYHSITQEIPAFARPHMRRMYTLVLMTFVALFWNFITEMSMYFIGTVDTTSMFFGLIYLGTGVLGAWKLWYRQIYYALRDNKMIKWWVFFLFFVAHALFAALITLSPAYFPTGAAGMWTITDTMNKRAIVGIFVLVNSVLWLLLDIGSWFYLIQSWKLYRSRSKTDPVQSQLINHVVENVA